MQSVGVPLTEVGALLVEQSRVDASLRPEADESFDVMPIERPQPQEYGQRFLLDGHLGSLARRMRLLGIDTEYPVDASDDVLIAESIDSLRTLLTRDRGLLRRKAIRATAAFVRGRSADEQVRDVLSRFWIVLDPYSRCVACNGPLLDAGKDEVRDALQPGTERCYDEFKRCVSCGRVYWRGAHAARLDRTVEAAVAMLPALRADWSMR